MKSLETRILGDNAVFTVHFLSYMRIYVSECININSSSEIFFDNEIMIIMMLNIIALLFH